MKRIYNYRTNKLYEFEAGGRDYDMTYHHYQRYNETVPELDPIFIELHSIGQRCHNLDKSIEYGAKGNEYVAFDVTGRPTYAFYYAPQIKEEWDYIEHFLANRSPNVYDDQNPTPEELLDLIPHLEMMKRLGKNNKGTMSDLSEICERCIGAIDKYVADFRAKDRTNESLYESEGDVVKFKLCVREEPVNDDVDVDIDDDDTLDAEYDSMEDALADAEELMREECEIEGFDFDEDCEELEYDGCEDCRVFETPEKRYIFVACPVDEEPNFELEIEDEFDDIPLDDVDEFEDELEDKRKDESVATRFSRLCNLFEAEGEDESDEDSEEDDSDDSDEDENADNDEETDDNGDDESSDESDEDEDEEIKAVAIKVNTDDVDACKEELVDAGISEDDIDVMDDKDGETEIRIDVNSISELKDYLSKKGIDLEEEIGGEIVSDDDEEGSEESGDEESDPDAEEEVPEYDLDDLGDIFGAEDGQ